MALENGALLPHSVSGREQAPLLDEVGFVSERLLHVGGRSIHYGIQHSLAVRAESPDLYGRISDVALSLFYGISSIAWKASGYVALGCSYIVRLPLTSAEKLGRVPQFRLTQRDAKGSLPPASNALTIMSLNIMGIPAFGCTNSGMPPCDERIEGIVRLISEKNPDIVLLQEAFMDVYAQRIFSRISSEYAYMIHQVEGGWFKALMGSGLVIISKFPVQDVSIRQYEDLLGIERLQTKSALAAVINYNGQQICLGTSHMQSDMASMHPLSVRNELDEAFSTVDELAKRCNCLALKLLIGDMNFDYVAGVYSEAEEKNATHVLVTRTDTEEKKLLEKNTPIPSGWSFVEFLKKEPYAGVIKADGVWEPSRSLALEQLAFSRWNAVFPTVQDGGSTSTWIFTEPPAERGRDGNSQITIIPRGKAYDDMGIIKGHPYLLYKNEGLRSVLLTGQNMLDQCYYSEPTGENSIRVKTEIIREGATQEAWLDTVSDHKALLCTVSL